MNRSGIWHASSDAICHHRATMGASEVKAGRAVPMKFHPGRLRPQHHPGWIPHLRLVECPASMPVSAVEPTSTDGAGSCDAAAQLYNYVWKTEHSWAGTCRTFDMTLNDGSSHQAMFGFAP